MLGIKGREGIHVACRSNRVGYIRIGSLVDNLAVIEFVVGENVEGEGESRKE